jgi:hypothetical protein
MNQYEHIQRPSLTGTPLTALLIVPSDLATLPRVAKRLRIVNTTTGFQEITIVTITDDEVTFLVPPQSLLFEDIMVKSVKATGTGILIIHGYFD